MNYQALALNGPSEFGVNDAEAMLNAIIANDKLIFEHLTYIKKLGDEMSARRMPIASSHLFRQPGFAAKFHQLRDRYIDRQTALQEDNAIKTKSWIDEKISAIKIWAKVNYGLGAVPAIPVAIGAVVGVVASVAIYYAFKPRYSESAQDLRISKQLKDLLSTAEPEVAREITEDLERQIDKAYNAGKRDGTFGGLAKLVQYGLFAGGSIALFVWGFPKITEAIDNTRNRLKEA